MATTPASSFTTRFNLRQPLNPLSERSSALFPDLDPAGDYAALLSAARSHPAVFLDCFCRIYDPTLRREFPFYLWPWQWEFLAYLMRHKRIVVLKARQLGVSWLVAGYALWLALFHSNTNILLVSRTEGVASDLLSKCLFMYNRLTKELKPPLSQRHDKANQTELSWHLINSKIGALASTKEAGRSESSTLVIADEWADHPFAEAMFAGYEPTVGSGGQIIGVSTAKGRRGLFYHTYMGAKRGENDFMPLFLPALLRPDYTEEFLASKRRTFEAAGEPWLFAQEFPCSSDLEAFGGSASTFFSAEALDRIFTAVRPPEWTPKESPWNGRLNVWSRRRHGLRYTIGADVGDTGPDYSVAMVGEAITGRHVATLRSATLSPYDFARCLSALGHLYGLNPDLASTYPMIAVERNGPGVACLEALTKVEDYKNLYRGKDARGKPVLGWMTTTASRPVLLSDFKAAVEEGSFYTEDEVFAEEASTFEIDLYGRPSAPSGGHDDTIFAAAVFWQARSAHPVLRGTRRIPLLSR